MAEGGEYEFHDDVIDDDVFDELSPPLHCSGMRGELYRELLR